MPSALVTRQPPGSFPGIMNLASAPTTRPTTSVATFQRTKSRPLVWSSLSAGSGVGQARAARRRRGRGLRPGGPYSITIQAAGFEGDAVTDVRLAPGPAAVPHRRKPA